MDFVMVVLSPGRPESCAKPNFLLQWNSATQKNQFVTHTQIQLKCKKCAFRLPHAREAQLLQPNEATNGSMAATAALVACIASTTAWSMVGLA